MIIDGRDYKPLASDILLFDTNVLMRVFSPINQGKCFGYDEIFSLAREAGSKLLLSSIQVSEFINRNMRTQFELYCDDKKESLDYKRDYRQTEDYFTNLEALCEIFENDIFPYFICIDDGFSKMDTTDLFCPSKEYDFNDKILEKIAISKHAKIVTSDFDFSIFSFDHEIITTLPKLLSLNNMMRK